MKLLDHLMLLILIIGGVHLLLLGTIQSDVITHTLAGLHVEAPRIFYIAVGVSAIWCLKYFTYTPKGGSRLRGR